MSRRALLTGGFAVAAGAIASVVLPEVASAAVGDTVHIGDDLYGRQTSFQVSSTGTSGGTSLASSFIGRNANSFPAFPVQGLGAVLWAGAPTGSAAVYGDATALNGYGVHAKHDLADGTALKVEGKSSFSRSGKGTISKGSASRTVTVASGVGTDAMIFATLQSSAGLSNHIRFVKRTSATTFKVYLTKAASSTATFAWFITD